MATREEVQNAEELNKLEEKTLKIAKEIAKLQADKAKQEGQFLSTAAKNLLQAEAMLNLQRDTIAAIKIQEQLAKASDERKIKLQQMQNDLFENQLDAISENLLLSQEQREEFRRQTEEIQEQIKSGEITAEQAKKLYDIYRKQTKELEKQTKAVDAIADGLEGLTSDFAGLFGISSKFSKGLNSVINNLKTAGLKGAFEGIFEGISSVINPINILGSAIKGLIEQSIALLKVQSEVTANTGLSQEFVNSFLDMRQNLDAAAPNAMFFREEMMKVGEALSSNLPIFTALGATARAEIGSIALMAQKLGVDVGDFSEAIVNMMEHSGESAVSAAGRFKLMTEELMKFGIQPDEAGASLAKFLPKLAHLGSRGPEVFIRMTKAAKAMNTTLEEMIKVTDGFKTFDDAIPKVNKLNAVFMKLTGTSNAFFDAQKLVNAATEEEQYTMIQEAVQAYGLSLKDLAEKRTPMARHALNALNDVMGTSNVSELIKQFGDLNEGLKPVSEQAKTFEEIIADTNNPMDMFRNVIEQMYEDGTLQELAIQFRNFMVQIVSFLKKYPDLIPNLLKMVAIFAGVKGVKESVGIFGSLLGMLRGIGKWVVGAGASVALWFSSLKLPKFMTNVMGFKGLKNMGDLFAAFQLRAEAALKSVRVFFSGLFGSGGKFANIIKFFRVLFTKGFQGLFTVASAKIGLAVGAVVGIFYSLVENWDTVVAYFDRKVDQFYKMFDGWEEFFIGIAEAAAMPFDAVIALINGVANAISDGLNWLFDTDLFGDFSIPTVSEMTGLTELAQGGTIGSSPTLALVGEQGPEMVVLPPRSTVMSNPDSQRIASFQEGTKSSTQRMQRTVSNMGNMPSANEIASKIVEGLGPMFEQIVSALNSGGQTKVYLDRQQVGNIMYDPISSRFKKEQTANVFGGMKR